MTEKRQPGERAKRKSDVTGEFSVDAVIEQLRRTRGSKFPPHRPLSKANEFDDQVLPSDQLKNDQKTEE